LFLFPKFICLQRSLTIALFLFYLVLAKAFENVMYEQMVSYVGRNGLISSFQFGLRPGHSTATAIARVSDAIRLNMESNQPTILVLLDFSKTFDSVCHGLFILKLRQRYGFHVIMSAALVSSYLFPRYQKVACGDDVSPLAPLKAGVPQGSPISLLCFSLFIDDMTEVLEFSKYHMYADDLQIYHNRSKEMLFECIREINSNLSKVFEWSLASSLKLNPSKSMVLPISEITYWILFRRFFIVTILSHMFLRQRTSCRS
jgi:hypothetical protein